MEILIDMFGAMYPYLFRVFCVSPQQLFDLWLRSQKRHMFSIHWHFIESSLKRVHCLWVLKDLFDEMHMENSTHFEVTYLWFNGVSNQSNNRVSTVRSWITISHLIPPTGSCLKTDYLAVKPALACFFKKSQKLKNSITMFILFLKTFS